MQYRDLGKTGLRVSALSYGAAALGDVYGAIDQATGIRALHTALDLGINLIDVSPYYGLTRAETVLGQALRQIARERYFLSTKVGRYDIDKFDFSAARVMASVDESLARLGVDYLDLVFCHDIEFGSLDQVISETLPALESLRAHGKVRFIGVSGFPLKVFRYVLERVPVDVILSYCQYNLQNDALADLLPYLKSKKVGIVNAAPTAMGLLTVQGPPPWHLASEEIKAVCAQAAAYCEAEGVNPVQLAIQFAVANASIQTTMVGSADPREIENDVAWAEQPLDKSLLEQVERILAPVHNRTWLSGRAENN